MDKILLQNLMFYGYHGVYEAERELGQKFYLDIVLEADLQKAGYSDELMDTIDYTAVYREVKEITEKSLEYLGVERKLTKEEKQALEKETVEVPDVTGMDSKDAIRNIRINRLNYTVIPEDQSGQSFVVIDQYPKAGTKVQKDSVVYIYSE